jgi:DNA-binding beta-propeller fold protein YncE
MMVTMDRRDFLKTSALGVAALSLWPAGCGDARSTTRTTVGTRYLAFGPDGARYEIRPAQHQVRRLDGDDDVVWEIGGLGSDAGDLNYPQAVRLGDDGMVYVVDRGNSRIAVFDADGVFVRTIGGRSAGDDRAGLDFVHDVALDPADDVLYVADANDDQIEVFDRSGNRVGVFGESGTGPTGLDHPTAIALDGDGNLHVVDRGNYRVHVFTPRGDLLRSYGGRGRDLGELQLPRDIVIDGDGRSWVADAAGNHLDVFAHDGDPIAVVPVRFADGRAGCPLFLSLTPNGNVYVTAVPVTA